MKNKRSTHSKPAPAMENKRPTRSNPPASLRERAEAALRATRGDIAKMPPQEIQRLVHELQVHQIELEMQNEELRRAHEELGQSRDRFNDLYDFAPAGYVTLDQDGTVIGANLTAATMLGVPRNKLVGRKFTRFVTRNAQDTLYLHQRAVLGSDGKQTCRLRLHGRNGATFPVQMESIGIRDAASGSAHCRCAIIDITELDQREEALLRAASLLRATLDSTADGLLVVDVDGKIAHYNGRFAEMWRLPATIMDSGTDEAAIQFVLDQLQEPERFLSKVRELYASPQQSSFDVLVFKDGRVFERYSQPEWLDDLPVGRVWSFRDVTARTRAEEALVRSHAELERRVIERTAELTHSNEALRASEERLRLVLRAGGMGTFELDLVSGEAHWNAIELELLGLQPGDAPAGPETFFRFVHPDDAGELRAQWEHAMQTGEFDAEFRIVRADGEERWLAGKGQFVVGLRSNGRGGKAGEKSSQWFMGVNFDITERKRGEAALRESEVHYRQLIHGLPVAVYTCDAKGRITLFNAAAVELWGREPNSRDRWCGSHRLFTPAGKRIPIKSCPMAVVIRDDEPIRGAELIVERPDGSRVHALAFPDPIHNSSGAVVGAVNVLVDITALKTAENALRTSERKLRTLSRTVQQSPVGVLITSPSDEIDYVNPKFLELTGYTLEDVLGGNPRLLKSGVHPPKLYREMWRTITSGRDWRGELCNRKKNGELFWSFVVIAPILDEHGTITHFVALMEDITERRQLEHDVLEISAFEQRRIGQDLHDDLCQWLTGTEFLAGALAKDLAIRSPADEPRALKIADAMRQANARARTLAHGLAPAVIEAAGLTGALRDLARNAEEMFRIRCAYIGPETLPTRDAVAALHLYRIAQEAISNAVRHGHAREVRILLQPGQDRVTMLIRDDGSGISQPQPEAMGMGLRTMRYRVGIIGGSLEIRPGSGGGTEIVCTFPKDL